MDPDAPPKEIELYISLSSGANKGGIQQLAHDLSVG
jgi:hypothetical protein